MSIDEELVNKNSQVCIECRRISGERPNLLCLLGESSLNAQSNHTENIGEFRPEYAGIFPKGSIESPRLRGPMTGVGVQPSFGVVPEGPIR
jgi:hypothetical protein